MSSRLLAAVAFALALSACEGVIGRPGPAGITPFGKPPSNIDPSRLRELTTAQVYEELTASCAGCHSAGMNKPWFQSLSAFQKLVVEDPAWVVPTLPDDSKFLSLLDGHGDGQYTQMPPTPSVTFSVLANEGRTTINMAELSLWISKLPPKDPNIIPQPTGPITNTSVRRKTAEQVLRTLYEQLGLNEGDFINSDLDAIADYAARSPDAYNQKYGDKPGASLFIALGGPNYVEGLARKNDIGPTFIQALTPISQAWCRRSVNKAGNQALLIDATLSDSTSTTAGRAAVENNIKSLHLKMLGAPADADDVADLLGLFQEIEPEGSATAWAAVCSVLIRDPLWILY